MEGLARVQVSCGLARRQEDAVWPDFQKAAAFAGSGDIFCFESPVTL